MAEKSADEVKGSEEENAMRRKRRGESGISLIETLIAILITFIVMAAIGGVVFSALVANKNQGIDQTRLTVLAQEKMNELTQLAYYNTGNDAPTCLYTLSTTLTANDTCMDTTTNTTLITDAGWSVGLTVGGGTNLLSGGTACANGAGYVDFVDYNGAPLSGACSSIVTSPYGYERRWQISNAQDSSSTNIPGLLQITVVVYDLTAVSTNANWTPPYVTMTTMKSW